MKRTKKFRIALGCLALVLWLLCGVATYFHEELLFSRPENHAFEAWVTLSTIAFGVGGLAAAMAAVIPDPDF